VAQACNGEARIQLGERDEPGDQPLRVGQKQIVIYPKKLAISQKTCHAPKRFQRIRFLEKQIVIYPKKLAISQKTCHAPKRFQRIRFLA